jgi:hypothetical protein
MHGKTTIKIIIYLFISDIYLLQLFYGKLYVVHIGETELFGSSKHKEQVL